VAISANAPAPLVLLSTANPVSSTELSTHVKVRWAAMAFSVPGEHRQEQQCSGGNAMGRSLERAHSG
jgi:hypothetical protein